MIKLTDILNEKEDQDFGAVAFGDSDQDKGFPAFLRMQGKSVKDEEENTKIERKILVAYRDWETDRKSTRLNSSHLKLSRMPSSA